MYYLYVPVTECTTNISLTFTIIQICSRKRINRWLSYTYIHVAFRLTDYFNLKYRLMYIYRQCDETNQSTVSVFTPDISCESAKHISSYLVALDTNIPSGRNGQSSDKSIQSIGKLGDVVILRS